MFALLFVFDRTVFAAAQHVQRLLRVGIAVFVRFAPFDRLLGHVGIRVHEFGPDAEFVDPAFRNVHVKEHGEWLAHVDEQPHQNLRVLKHVTTDLNVSLGRDCLFRNVHRLFAWKALHFHKCINIQIYWNCQPFSSSWVSRGSHFLSVNDSGGHQMQISLSGPFGRENHEPRDSTLQNSTTASPSE